MSREAQKRNVVKFLFGAIICVSNLPIKFLYWALMRNACFQSSLLKIRMVQGVRPQALSRVGNRELAEIISLCLAQREERPRARQLLKHPYFDSIRSEKLVLKLGQEALGVQDPSQPVPELAVHGSRSKSEGKDTQQKELFLIRTQSSLPCAGAQTHRCYFHLQ